MIALTSDQQKALAALVGNPGWRSLRALLLDSILTLARESVVATDSPEAVLAFSRRSGQLKALTEVVDLIDRIERGDILEPPEEN